MKATGSAGGHCIPVAELARFHRQYRWLQNAIPGRPLVRVGIRTIRKTGFQNQSLDLSLRPSRWPKIVVEIRGRFWHSRTCFTGRVL
jgi:hypothetical protein